MLKIGGISLKLKLGSNLLHRCVIKTFFGGLTKWNLEKTQSKKLDLCPVTHPKDSACSRYLSSPPDRTWHKVNDPKVDYSGDLGEWKVGHEPRVEPYWTMLVIGTQCTMGPTSLAGVGPKSESRHVCLIISKTWLQGPVLYKGDKVVDDAAQPPEGGPAEFRRPFGLKSATKHWPSGTDSRQSAEKPLREEQLHVVMDLVFMCFFFLDKTEFFQIIFTNFELITISKCRFCLCPSNDVINFS